MSIKPLSLFKIIALVLVALCFIMMFLPWITVKASVMGQSLFDEGISLFTVSGRGSFWTVLLLLIFVILFFPAMALAVFGILKDRNNFALPVSALAVIMFLFDVFACFWAKGKANELIGEYAEYIEYMGGEYMGGSIGVHVGVGAWLFLLFGLGACGLLFYEDYSQGKNFFDFSSFKSTGFSVPKVNLGAIGGWTCPSCGAKNGSGQNFCTSCGTKKPEPRRCSNCGATLKPGEVFCSNCGTRAE